MSGPGFSVCSVNVKCLSGVYWIFYWNVYWNLLECCWSLLELYWNLLELTGIHWNVLRIQLSEIPVGPFCEICV